MDDLREKVIRGIEIHLKPNSRCNGCPYPNNGLCGDQLYRDALTLLKAQEPRLITSDDFVNADAWGMIPAWIEYSPAVEGAEPGWAIICSDILSSPFKKAWTSRPTDEQREKVKWE